MLAAGVTDVTFSDAVDPLDLHGTYAPDGRQPQAGPVPDSAPTDPARIRELHEAMNEQAQKLLDRMPDFVFSAAGPVHVSRDLGLLNFNLGVPEQPPAVSGIDVALVRDGRIAVLHTLLTAPESQ